jgi:hypothetical protein
VTRRRQPAQGHADSGRFVDERLGNSTERKKKQLGKARQGSWAVQGSAMGTERPGLDRNPAQRRQQVSGQRSKVGRHRWLGRQRRRTCSHACLWIIVSMSSRWCSHMQVKGKPSAANSGRNGQSGGLARLTCAQACARLEIGHDGLKVKLFASLCVCARECKKTHPGFWAWPRGARRNAPKGAAKRQSLLAARFSQLLEATARSRIS